MNEIAAIVTTYNRVALLRENVSALLNQSYEKIDVLIIDNNSTDNTKEFVSSISDKRVIYYNTGSNLGGAGGFSFGLKKAIESGYKYAWLMDDDTIPTTDALQEIINITSVIDYRFSFIASSVYWTDGTQFPMNTPNVDMSFKYNIDTVINNGIISIDNCSFVGCFVNIKVAKTVGLPISEYFIYGDDIEYTTRLRNQSPAYWAIKSKLIHKAPSKAGSSVIDAPSDRIDRFYMQTRNGIHLHRTHGGLRKYIFEIFKRMIRILKRSKDHKVKRLSVLAKGLIAGFFFNPEIKYVK